MSIWKKTPKVELHLHLEGAAPPTFIRSLAAKKGIDLGAIFDADGNYTYDGFTDFLRVYEVACTVLQTPQDFHDLTRAVLTESASHNVIYTEIFTSPDFCGNSDPVAWQDYFSAITEAAASERRRTGIETRFCGTCVRHFGPEKAVIAAQRCAESAGDWMTGFGMGGAEGFMRPADFTGAFDIAREAGLPLTTHAGEFGGADSVRESLDHLGVTRIGHGVRAIEDADLVARLVAENITLEVNLGSNIALAVYPDWADHPIARLRAAGVPVTISTDDPPYFQTDMTAEFDMLEQTFGWGAAEFAQANETAVNAAFCDAATKDKLRTTLNGANNG